MSGRMFATVVPGLAPILVRELQRIPGIDVTDQGFDGRSDVVAFQATRSDRAAVLELGLSEDVFVEVGRALRADGDQPAWIAGRIWRPERVSRALSVWAEQVRPLRAAMTFRVISRVLQERSFLRTDLRRHLTEAIRRDRPRWRTEDPGQVEVWIVEYRQGRFLCGLRLSSAKMRQHNGRHVERPGALRPTVANAMVKLAGRPSGVLLDPCCGSGTILAEATASGWATQGSDIDPDAVRTARRNLAGVGNGQGVAVEVGDVRSLALPDGSVTACVANLPFGRQYGMDGSPATWLRAALSELTRVTRPGGRIVLLVPEIPRAAVPAALRARGRYPLRLLGMKTAIWAYDR